MVLDVSRSRKASVEQEERQQLDGAEQLRRETSTQVADELGHRDWEAAQASAEREGRRQLHGAKKLRRETSTQVADGLGHRGGKAHASVEREGWRQLLGVKPPKYQVPM